MKLDKIYILMIIFVAINIIAQTGLSINQDSSNKVFSKDKNLLKIIQLEDSIRKNGDAASYFELAKIYWSQDSFLLRNKAYDLAKTAVEKDEKNIEYKYFYADICQSFSRFESIDLWNDILKIDSTQIRAWLNLAEFSAREFLEWDKSVRVSEIGLLSLQQWANEDYNAAIKYYEKAEYIDSTNYDLCLKVSLFYEKNGHPQLGIKYLERLVKAKKANKDIYLALGLMYYQSKKFQRSYENYSKALTFMSRDEREDFIYNSAELFLKNELEKLNLNNKTNAKEYIEYYWKSKDPLLMTKYNERLLEHYSRVAYANLNFSEPSNNLSGWKTDRGEMVVRYGEPINRVRIRPEIAGASVNLETGRMVKSSSSKQEIWSFPDFSISFVDTYFSGNYRFAGNKFSFVDNMRRNTPTIFYPKFAGPIFDVGYQFYQFASTDKTQTDIYLFYEIDYSDYSSSKDKFSEGYDVNFSLLDDNFNERWQMKKTITDMNQRNNRSINTIELVSEPVSGNVAFEILRKKDNAIASYHGRYKNKDFGTGEFDISNIVLASEVKIDGTILGGIHRNDYSILPNPTKSFSKNEQFFLYFEIYNLKLNTNKLTEFEQKITIQKKEEGGIINNILSVVGLDKEGKKIALTSKYQTQEKDPQMYLQLDMTKYEPGEYTITVTIKDNVTGKEVSSNTEINWQ